MYKWYFHCETGAEPAWTGPYDSRDEAMVSGFQTARKIASNMVHLIEAENAPMSIEFVLQAEDIIDDIIDVNEAFSDDEGRVGLENVTAEQAAELEVELEAALKNWMVKYGYDKAPYAIGNTRSEESVSVPVVH